MDVSVIYCACNQGDWVRRTIPQAKASLAGLNYEIIVIDDQSVDGCCHGLDRDVLILRTRRRLGVTGSRRFAVERAKGNVLLFSDPHCDYWGTALSDLVAMAVETRCICQPKSVSKPECTNRPRFGGVLLPCDRALRVKYQYGAPAKYPALLGTVYAVRREVYDYLGGWPKLPGVWGYAEQALTLQSWFLGTPIRVDDRHTICHYDYQPNGKFPYKVSLIDQASNAHWVHALYFPESYFTHWNPIITARFGKNEFHRNHVWSRDFERCRYYIAGRATRSEEDFYREYLKMPFPSQYPCRQMDSTGEPIEEAQKRIANAIGWLERSMYGCLKKAQVVDVGTNDSFILKCLKEREADEVRAYVNVVPEQSGFCVLQSDLTKLPEPDGACDVVVSCHAVKNEAMRDEMLRIAKSMGYIMSTIPLGQEWSSEEQYRALWESSDQVENGSVKTKVKKCHCGQEVRLVARKVSS